MAYQPPYNPGYPSAPPPQQQGQGVGFEHHQQGPPPGYGQPPPYSEPHQGQYGQYGPPGGQYGPPGGQYGPPGGQYGPPGGPVYTQQPSTVYVYDDHHQRKRETGAEECFLFGLCAACLCCCLMSD